MASTRSDGKSLLVSAACLVLAGAVLAACGGGGKDEKGAGAGTIGGAGGADTDGSAKAQAMLAALGAPASAEARAQYDQGFEAAGAEPDWTLSLFNDAYSFERPGLDPVTGFSAPRDIRANGMLVNAGPLTVSVRPGACAYSGGETYPYQAEVLFEGIVYAGCARPATGDVGGGRGWAQNLDQFLPAIDVCLDRVKAKPARVTIAFVDESGATSVRLLESDGGRAECVTRDGAFVSIDALSDRDVFPGERAPLFTRAPTAPPGGMKNEEVSGPSGVVGWLSTKQVQ